MSARRRLHSGEKRLSWRSYSSYSTWWRPLISHFVRCWTRPRWLMSAIRFNVTFLRISYQRLVLPWCWKKVKIWQNCFTPIGGALCFHCQLLVVEKITLLQKLLTWRLYVLMEACQKSIDLVQDAPLGKLACRSIHGTPPCLIAYWVITVACYAYFEY